MDRVFVKDLLLRAIIGINDDERVKKQDVLVNIELEADCRPAAASDAIEDAVNYREIAKSTIDLVVARVGSADDIAAAAVYLVRSRFVTGEVLHVTGGEHL